MNELQISDCNFLCWAAFNYQVNLSASWISRDIVESRSQLSPFLAEPQLEPETVSHEIVTATDLISRYC